MTASEELVSLQAALQSLYSSDASPTTFIAQARGSIALLAALPAKYSTVLHDTLDRLESGALFSEESCSFSQRDLLDGLKLWCEKANTALAHKA